ncbi:aldo/keto reductase [Dictyobacter aurantiacus]|uniref:NADP-dependent aryl-alcohol dehydrogenase n=1 Tax=Dictyobacter aurantiacus TaxID=1936993 RepID=A0A401ZB04_9CHLR|nr:aldo/keto reductase [Dictyobacter aurantiacus]GCE04045.1 NADP-dependent aryl-alcohol dehydrogenase [Dictyobacter aurantiacus]
MRYRKLGRTGLKVSALCLGTMQWGWTADENAAFEVMDAFIEKGGNFLDTADFYSRWLAGHEGGESEAIIGRWLKSRHKRGEMIVATKVYQPMGDSPNDRGLSRKHILDGVNASLRRLQTDYIDLYLAHAFDAETPIDETLKAFDDLQRMGKVRYVGASNYPAWRLMESLWSADTHNTVRYDVLEPHYNLVHRAEFESDLKLICEQHQIGVIPYSSLAGGFLTGKYERGGNAESERASSIAQKYDIEGAWRTLDVVKRIAREIETTPSAVALAWLLAQTTVTAPIIGANSADQLQPSLEAVDITLVPDHITALNQASSWD